MQFFDMYVKPELKSMNKISTFSTTIYSKEHQTYLSIYLSIYLNNDVILSRFFTIFKMDIIENYSHSIASKLTENPTA